MKFSNLQKFILKQIWENEARGSSHHGSKTTRTVLEKFYDNKKNPPPQKIRVNIITTSIERLINKGLIVGFGEKTQHKLFIREIKLTAQGRQVAQVLLSQQAKLPFKKRSARKK